MVCALKHKDSANSWLIEEKVGVQKGGLCGWFAVGNQTYWDVHVSRQRKVKLVVAFEWNYLQEGVVTSGEPVSDLLRKKCSFLNSDSCFYVIFCGAISLWNIIMWLCSLIFLPLIFLTIISLFIVHRTVHCSKKCRPGKIHLVEEVPCCTDKDQICNDLFIWLGIPNKLLFQEIQLN